jgi:LPXTG-motif cell wall-anchored protein
VETHAPDGYVILTRGVDFSIDASSGTVTLIKESTETVEGETVTVYVPAETSDYPDASANGNAITVKNTPGAALPNTGGPGTNLIYLLGFMLTGLAGVGLVMRKRRRDAA